MDAYKLALLALWPWRLWFKTPRAAVTPQRILDELARAGECSERHLCRRLGGRNGNIRRTVDDLAKARRIVVAEVGGRRLIRLPHAAPDLALRRREQVRQALDGHPAMPRTELAARLGVSTRTLYRHLAALREEPPRT